MVLFKMLHSCFHLFDDVVDGLAAVFQQDLFEHRYLCFKSYQFSCCHGYWIDVVRRIQRVGGVPFWLPLPLPGEKVTFCGGKGYLFWQ